jgi:hypothetical protein
MPEEKMTQLLEPLSYFQGQRKIVHPTVDPSMLFLLRIKYLLHPFRQKPELNPC